MTNFLANPLTIVGIEKKVMAERVMRSAYWLNHDPSGLVEAGLRSGDEVTVSQPPWLKL